MLIKFINNKFIWEQFLAKLEGQNFLHSWNWGEFQKALGKKIFRLGFYQNNQLKGVAFLIKETAKRGTYLASPGGPLLKEQDEKTWLAFVGLAKEIAQIEKAWFVRVRSQLLDKPETRNFFIKLGFVSAPMHMHAETTWQLDIFPSEEQLQAAMGKNHRYELRKAKRHKVQVIDSQDIADIDVFYQMQLETAQRKKWVPFSKSYLKEEFRVFAKDDQVRIFKAFCQNKLVAMAMIIFYGREAVYHHAVGSQKARKIAAAYAICWQAILAAKKRNLPIFNFWGLAPEEKKKHRYLGMNHFKKGFGGFPVRYLHAHDFPVSRLYWLTHLFEKLRKIHRGL